MNWPIRFLIAALCASLSLPAAEEAGQSLAERNLRRIAERQRAVLATAAKQGENLDEGSLRQQMQSISHDYELLLRDNPSYATAYAAYGYFLSKTSMRKEAAVMLLKANRLDGDIPLVKNQLGTLLAEARDDFIKSGEWTRVALERAMHQAFKRAAELAPERFEFAYRYAESFYDLEAPDWNEAVKLWSDLEEKAPTAIERQTMRLHAANILFKLAQPEHAHALLATVDEPSLQGQKQKLVAQPAETAKK